MNGEDGSTNYSRINISDRPTCPTFGNPCPPTTLCCSSDLAPANPLLYSCDAALLLLIRIYLFHNKGIFIFAMEIWNAIIRDADWDAPPS